MHRPTAGPLSQRTPTRLPGAAATLRRSLDACTGHIERLASRSAATFILGAGATGVMLVLGPLPLVA